MTDDDTNTETDDVPSADGEPIPSSVRKASAEARIVEAEADRLDENEGQTHVVPDADPENSDGELVEAYRRTRIEAKRDPLTDDFQIGDPVIDLSNGRTMIVVETPQQSVAEWSGDNDYDLTENYANERLRTRPNDRVYGCVYAAGIQSEPSGPRGGSGPYTFPSSRLARVTIESVEGVRRVYDQVAVDVLRRLFVAAEEHGVDSVRGAAAQAVGPEVFHEAAELADVDTRFGGEDGG